MIKNNSESELQSKGDAINLQNHINNISIKDNTNEFTQNMIPEADLDSAVTEFNMNMMDEEYNTSENNLLIIIYPIYSLAVL